MTRGAWWLGSLIAMAACGGGAPRSGGGTARASGPVELALGAEVAAVRGLVELRTDGDATYYRGGSAPAELATLAITDTTVVARAGVVERIRYTLADPEAEGDGRCDLAAAYRVLLEHRWKPPYPEWFATDALCTMREELAPGQLVASCVGEALRRDGQRVTVLDLRGAGAGGEARERVLVEYALDDAAPGQRDPADASHARTRLDEASALIDDWERRVAVAGRVLDNEPVLATDAGKRAALLSLRQVRRARVQAECSYNLGLIIHNQHLRGANLALDRGDLSVVESTRALTQVGHAVDQRFADVKAASNALFAQVKTRFGLTP